MEKITVTEFILAVIGSGSFGSLLMAWLNRRKSAAEIESLMVSTYGQMLEDLRKQMSYQEERINSQGEQIVNLQNKEVQYLKIINNNQKTERELRNKIREQDDQIRKQDAQIKKQDLRIKELEEKLNA